MSGSGTRRTTILKRRASQTARLIFYAKRGGIALAVLAIAVIGFRSFTHSAWYQEKRVGVSESIDQKMAGAGFRTRGFLIDGRVHTTRDELLAASGVKKDVPIFVYDLPVIQKKVAALPWVKTATVERRLPDTIYIGIEERAPVALYQKDNKLMLVDGEGQILTDKNLGDFHDLVMVTGENAPQNASALAGILDAEPDFKNRIAIARWIGNRRWDIELKNNVTVRLPEDDPGLAVKRLTDAQKSEKILDRNMVAIDLRDVNRIIIQTAPGAVDKYQAGYKPGKNI